MTTRGIADFLDCRFSIFDCRLKESAIVNRQSSIRKRQRRGLTFVELLMAVTMFSILIVGVFAHLQAGVLAWRRSTSTIEHLQRTRVALDRLGQDLANAVVFDPSGTWEPQHAFEGARLQFYTVRPEGMGAQPGGAVWFVTYTRSEDAETAALTRSAQTVQQAKANFQPTPARLVAPMTKFAIRYGYQGSQEPSSTIVWDPTWDGTPAELPKLVEVTIEFDAGVVSPREVRHVFVIPSGILKTVEAAP